VNLRIRLHVILFILSFFLATGLHAGEWDAFAGLGSAYLSSAFRECYELQFFADADGKIETFYGFRCQSTRELRQLQYHRCWLGSLV